MRKLLLFSVFSLLFSNADAQAYKGMTLKTSNDKREVKFDEKVVLKTISKTKYKGRLTSITDSSLFINSTEIKFKEIFWVKHIRKQQLTVAQHILANGVISGGVIFAFLDANLNPSEKWKKKANPLFVIYPSANVAFGAILMKKRKFALKRELKISPL